MEKLLLTRKAAANALSISVDTLDDLSRGGKLTRVKLVPNGKRIYFRQSDLTAFVSGLERNED